MADIAVINTIIGGTVIIVGAITGGAVKIIKAISDSKNQGIEAGQARDHKLNRIETLVDGRYSDVLQELADLKLITANASGLKGDMDRALDAQHKANEQAKRVAKSKENE